MGGLLKDNRRKILPVFLILVLLLVLTLACSLPFRIVWNGSDADNQQKTVDANSDLLQTLSANTSNTDTEQDTGSEDDEGSIAGEEIPSETPSLTPSPTITDTPAPEKVTAILSNNTNCRLGPKDVFELIHIFLQGDKVDLLGKNQEGTFWYVQDQDTGTIQCWLWSEYASPNGVIESLPVFTPPPEPAPIMNFVLSYKDTSGETTVIMNVRNTGNVALQSYTATFTDTVTSETIVVSGNKFGNAAKVSVGNIGVISSNPFSASTIGHQMNVTVKTCSEDGQAGKCFSSSINFESK